jgi:hypothetical protein
MISISEVITKYFPPSDSVLKTWHSFDLIDVDIITSDKVKGDRENVFRYHNHRTGILD